MKVLNPVVIRCRIVDGERRSEWSIKPSVGQTRLDVWDIYNRLSRGIVIARWVVIREGHLIHGLIRESGCEKVRRWVVRLLEVDLWDHSG
jgi:hypothetical protein